VGILDDAALAGSAAAAGFTGDNLRLAVAVALAESGGNPKAVGDIDNPVAGARSIGYWQVNTHYHPSYDQTKLTDGLYNARAAFAISAGGTSWTPWSTYKNGAYRQYVERAQKSTSKLDAPAIAAKAAGYETWKDAPKSGDTFGFSIGTPFGDITSESGPTGVLADGANAVAGAVLDPLQALAGIAGALLNPRTWLRVLFVLLAAVLIVGGARLIISDTTGL
jgi:hypothetical protein